MSVRFLEERGRKKKKRHLKTYRLKFFLHMSLSYDPFSLPPPRLGASSSLCYGNGAIQDASASRNKMCVLKCGRLLLQPRKELAALPAPTLS